MELFAFEVTNGPATNWGKFAVGRPGNQEWGWRSRVDEESHRPLLGQLGWSPKHLWVWDLQTGEGAMFRHGGYAPADLEKHRIWVCPMFEPFLVWLYQQDVSDLSKLPKVINLPDAPFAVYGYRRPGPDNVAEAGRSLDQSTVHPAEEKP